MKKSLFTLLAVAAFGTLNSASAAVISGNFVGNTAGGGGPATLLSTDVAGVVAVDNWNNLSGASSPNVTLLDNTGNDSGVLAAWNANSTWRLNSPGATPTGPDATMLNGYLDSDDTSLTTLTLSGITFANYDIYIYTNGDVAEGRNSSYTLGASTIWVTDASNSSVFDQASGTFSGDPNSVGNYVRFTGLSGGTANIIATPGTSPSQQRAVINGFQIVAVPEPATVSIIGLGLASMIFRRRR